MGFRFRKSINVGPLRVNLSKSGVGYSIGKKGVRLTKTASGRRQATVSVPGTGISYVKDLGGSKSKKKKNASRAKDNDDIRRSSNKAIWVLIAVVIIVGVLIWYKL